MEMHIFFGIACMGLALALLLAITSRLRLSTGQKLWKFASLLTSLVGGVLIVVVVLFYSMGTTRSFEGMRQGFFNIEVMLRHWFQNLSLR